MIKRLTGRVVERKSASTPQLISQYIGSREAYPPVHDIIFRQTTDLS